MKRFSVFVGLTAMVALAISLNGCQTDVSDKAATPPAGQAGSDSHDHASDDHASHDHAGHEHSAADVEKAKAELAKLSPEDAQTAEKQHVCPVTGKMLGTMGPPKKVDVNGRQVWICCEGCREELMSNPDKYP